MVQVFVDELDAPAPDRYLGVGSSDVDALQAALESELADLAPDVVLVYGDTNSTLAGARAAKSVGALLIHIEAGIRSFDRSMPEEVNRVETDALSELRLAPTGLATWFLTAFEGLDGVTSPAVGNLAMDAWRRHRPLMEQRPAPAIDGDYAVLTLHRQATVDDPEVLGRLLAELAALPFSILFPVHPRTADRVERFGLRWPANLTTAEPMGYLDFGRAMSGASVLLTDSGGIQEEAIAMGIPCVTLRPNTERMETVFLRANRLFDPARDADLDRVVHDARSGYGERPYTVNPFGVGHTAERIVAVLEYLAGRPLSVSFPDESGLASPADLKAAADAVMPARSDS